MDGIREQEAKYNISRFANAEDSEPNTNANEHSSFENQLKLINFQQDIITFLLDSSKNSNSAYQAAIEMKESILRLEFESKISTYDSQKIDALNALEECQESLRKITTARDEYIEQLTELKKENSQLKIERGAAARDVKRLSLEKLNLDNVRTKLKSTIEQNKILTIERGRYARECKSLAIATDGLKNEILQMKTNSKKLSDELAQTRNTLFSLTQTNDNIVSSKRYKFASLLGNGGNSFLGFISLLWKVPRFLWRNK